jgi:hypothetical protein
MTSSAMDRSSLNLHGSKAIRGTEELYECDGAKEDWNCS